MAGIPLRRRRGPMSAAQKAALKKAQEISARKRRGTGKPDSPTTQRMASLAKKPSAPQYPNEGPSPVVRKRRKAQPKDIMKPTAGDGKTKYQYNPDLSVAENMRLQKEFDAKKNAPKPQKPSSTTGSGGSSKSMGTADPGTMGVSQILKERKELIAKRNGEGLSKEEAARLVAIQAESALRHQNRKAGKGTGPTKVALGDKGNISKRPDTPLQKKMDTAKKSKPADPISGNISQRPDNPDQKDVKDLTDQELKNRLQKLDDLDKQLMARKRKYANDPEELAAIKKRRDRINAQWDEAALEQKKRDEQKKSPQRASSKPPSSYDDKTTFGSMAPDDRQKMSEMRRNMQELTKKWLQRDNVVEELNAAKTVGELVDAAQSIYWYLDEMDQNGSGKAKPRDEMDKMFTELKKYSNRYRSKSTAGVSQPPLRRNQHNPRAGVFGADKWGRRPGGR